LLVSWFWTTQLPSGLREVAPLGTVGVHPSLLPRHRGPDPYFWAIHDGDAMTGVTAHVLADEYDTGAILGTREVALDPRWNAWTLAKQLDRPSLALLRATVARFAAGDPPTPRPQDESQATFAPSPDEDELAIDWRESPAAIERLVRAAAPWPGATFTLGEEFVVVEEVRVLSSAPAALSSGEAWIDERGLPCVVAGRGAVELVRGSDEHDRPIFSADWVKRIVDLRETSA